MIKFLSNKFKALIFRIESISHKLYLKIIYFLPIFRTQNYNKLLSFKNKHKNQTCYFIGNGPSLTTSDILLLKGKTTFGFNKIYNFTKDIDFSPTYYFAQDQFFLEEVNSKSINLHNLLKKTVFFIDYRAKKHLYFKRNKSLFNFYRSIYWYENQGPIPFSLKPYESLYDGNTVTYSALQFAFYMGFKNIVLLGFDHRYSKEIKEAGKKIINVNTKDHFYVNETSYKNASGYANVHLMESSFKTALFLSQQRSINIFNATRGGYLEVFKRIMLEDSLVLD